jgi:hypothetical protein
MAAVGLQVLEIVGRRDPFRRTEGILQTQPPSSCSRQLRTSTSTPFIPSSLSLASGLPSLFAFRNLQVRTELSEVGKNLRLISISAVWLCKMGREEKSKKAMRRLVGNVRDYDIDHEYLVMKHHLAESQALMEKSSKLGWIACFKGTNLRRTLISTIPFSMQVGRDHEFSARNCRADWHDRCLGHRTLSVDRLFWATPVSACRVRCGVNPLLTIGSTARCSLLLQSRWSRRRVPGQSYYLLYPRLSDSREFLFRGKGWTKTPFDLRWSHHGDLRHRDRSDRYGGVVIQDRNRPDRRQRGVGNCLCHVCRTHR